MQTAARLPVGARKKEHLPPQTDWQVRPPELRFPVRLRPGSSCKSPQLNDEFILINRTKAPLHLPRIVAVPETKFSVVDIRNIIPSAALHMPIIKKKIARSAVRNQAKLLPPGLTDMPHVSLDDCHCHAR